MTTNDDQLIPRKLSDGLVQLVKKAEINTAKAVREYKALEAKYDKDTGHQKATIVALRTALDQAQDKLAKTEESLESRHRLIEYMGEQLNEGRDRENKYVDSLWDNHNREENRVLGLLPDTVKLLDYLDKNGYQPYDAIQAALHWCRPRVAKHMKVLRGKNLIPLQRSRKPSKKRQRTNR